MIGAFTWLCVHFFPPSALCSDQAGLKDSNYRSSEEWGLLADLVRGLAGGDGSLSRSQFVLAKLSLPSIINEMAAQVRLCFEMSHRASFVSVGILSYFLSLPQMPLSCRQSS